MNRDQPRPSGYFPNTPSQWREPTIDDCTWYATECAFERASKDHITRHPVKVLRANSVDQEGGTTVELCLSEVQRLWPTRQHVAHDYGKYSLMDIVTALTTDATIVIGGDYEKLPPHYRRWTNNDIFNHAMAHWDIRVTETGLKTFLYDPLGGGPERKAYMGEWIDINNLYGPDNFVWEAGNERYMVGIVANREVDNEVIDLNVHEANPASRAVRVTEGAKAFISPSVTSNEIRTFRSKEVWHPCLGKTKNAFRLVLWMNDNGWEGGYVPKADIIETRVVPAPDTDEKEEIERLNDIIDDLASELTAMLKQIEAESTPAD